MGEEEPAQVPSTLTSTQLLERLKQPRDNSAWNLIVERYRPLIVNVARRKGFNPSDAEDVAQQALAAFARAYGDGKYDRDKGRLRHWFMAIARNQMYNYFRDKKSPELQVADDGDQTHFFARVADGDELEQMWDQECHKLLLQHSFAIIESEVEPKTMDAFRLFVQEEWPADKVSKKLDMTPNAIYRAKHRILARLREIMSGLEEDW